MTGFVESIKRHKIIAILRRVPYEKLLDTALAIAEGGVRIIEVTFDHEDENRDKNAQRAIKILASGLPDDVLVGAGTVLTPEQAGIANDSGAGFIVSPNTDADVINEALKLGMGCLPGALTPSEVAFAYKCGAHAVKLFPAGDMGISYFKSVRAPLLHVPLVAVGAVNIVNMKEYMEAGAIGVGIGTGIADSSAIKKGDFDMLTRLARKYCQMAKEVSV